MSTKTDPVVTKVAGISYYHAEPGAVLTARDGKVEIPLGDIPLPLLNEELSAAAPSYDAVGRGIYQLLRTNPDAAFAGRYAILLRDAYPHLLAELATNLFMLEKKDVDVPYLDRKITYLKIFALLEPGNPRFPLEIGTTYLEKGLTLAALGNTTLHLFSAEKYLKLAAALSPENLEIKQALADVCYILGKYEAAAGLWGEILPALTATAAARITQRAALIESGNAPAIPAVDYLQAVGVALEAYESADYEEAAAILLDVLEAVSVYDEFPLAEINYLLGLCYVKMDIPKYAEQYFQHALTLRHDYTEASQELQKLGVL